METPTVINKTSDPLPISEAKRVIAELIRDKKYRWALLIAIPFYTFLRNSDYKHLKYSDFDKEKLILYETKTFHTRAKRKPRIIKISDELKSIVNQCKPEVIEPETFIFASTWSNSPISIQYVNKCYTKIKAKYNIQDCEHFTSHSARKGGVTALYNKMGKTEAALILISKILGHSSTEITMLYIGLTQKMMDDCFDSL